MQMGACATVNDLVSYGSGLKLTIARINGSEPLANNNQNLYLNLKERKKKDFQLQLMNHTLSVYIVIL